VKIVTRLVGRPQWVQELTPPQPRLL